MRGDSVPANSYLRIRSPMRATAIVFALTLVPALAAAQTDDADWLDRCRRDYNNDRERVCDVRLTGFRPARGALNVSPGTNGGVKVIGWNRDSVAVHARISAYAYNTSEANALARGVQIGRSGNTLTADGPDTGRGE